MTPYGKELDFTPLWQNVLSIPVNSLFWACMDVRLVLYTHVFLFRDQYFLINTRGIGSVFHMDFQYRYMYVTQYPIYNGD